MLVSVLASAHLHQAALRSAVLLPQPRSPQLLMTESFDAASYEADRLAKDAQPVIVPSGNPFS